MAILLSALVLWSVNGEAAAVNEGFDTGVEAVRLGSGEGRSGESSVGWLSDWHIKQGTSRILADDLSMDGLSSLQGLVSAKGKSVAMRQLAETFSGDVYGSFRVRGGQLNPNSMLGLLISLPDAHPVTPKTSFLSFLATRWGSGLGGIVVGGKPFPVERGEALRAKQTVLVLWQIAGLAEPGKAADPVIEMWLLNEQQTGHFAQAGIRSKALNAAKLGAEPTQVMQRGRVALRDSKLTVVKGLVVSTFAAGAGKADLDEIRISRDSLADAAGVASRKKDLGALPSQQGRGAARPNVLLITMDDMNWDSMGAYGSKVAGLTPHMDSIAQEGFRFQYAYNQTSSCVPSRTTYQTGRYPHTNGVLSFYNVAVDFPTLPEILRANGYFTGCINKPRDTSLTDDFEKYWDYHQILKVGPNRDARVYEDRMAAFLDKVGEAQRPFYCVVNIADPHKPFYDDADGVEQGLNNYAPSVRYETSDVEIPGFLPQHPEILEEIRNYTNTVKRGDDCVGVILKTLRERDLEQDTVVIFVSDHGMPLPFAKSSLYADGLRTPWVIRWPGKVERGAVDTAHLVSAIDFMPTVLEIVGVAAPEGRHGTSVLPAIMGKPVAGMESVYAEFNDNAGGLTFPMRAIHTRRYTYIFNAWGTGNHTFRSAASWHTSANVMKRLAQTDPVVADRYNFLVHRCIEEFYDLESDPFALRNLIDDADYQPIIATMREDMEAWMRSTNDYVLPAFLVRDQPDALDAFMAKADAAALERAQTIQWKRYKNRAGGTGGRSLLYEAP